MVSMKNRMRAALTLGLPVMFALGVSILSQPVAAIASGTAGGDKVANTPGPPGVDGSGVPASVWAKQHALDGVATQIEATGKADPGYSNVEVDAQSNAITIYLTAQSAQSRRASYEKLIPADVSVNFVPAMLSASQQDTLSAAVMANEATMTSSGITPTAWGVQTLGGPYVITYAPIPGAVTSMAAVQSKFNLFGSGTVVFVAGALPKPLSRGSDSAPFYGGDNAFGPTDGSLGSSDCTSGFTGKSTTNQADYIIVAWHCTWPGGSTNAMWNGPSQSGSYFGPVTTSDPTADLAYVKTTAGTLPYIWAETRGQSQFVKQVVGVLAPQNGDLVCTSGAYSEATCNEKITSFPIGWSVRNAYTNQVQSVSSGYIVYALTSGALVAQSGDSGGPIFVNTGPNNSQAYAMGSVSAGVTGFQITCPSWVVQPEACFSRIYSPNLSHWASVRSLDLTRG